MPRASVDPLTLVSSGWLPRACGLMLACQLPGLVQRGIRPEKMGRDAETGFVLHRVVTLAVFASMLALGRFALPVLVIVAQVFGAGTEIMRDEYVKYLVANRRSPTSAAAAAPTRR